MTLAQAAAALRKFIREKDAPVLAAFKRSMTPARRAAVAAYKASGLGRALWGKGERRAGVPRLMVSVVRAKRSGDGWTSGLKAAGVAATIEQGGRLEPHRIEAKIAPVLVFQAPDGETIATKVVNHPGAPVQARPVLDRAVRGELPEIESTVKKALEDRAAKEFA